MPPFSRGSSHLIPAEAVGTVNLSLRVQLEDAHSFIGFVRARSRRTTAKADGRAPSGRRPLGGAPRVSPSGSAGATRRSEPRSRVDPQLPGSYSRAPSGSPPRTRAASAAFRRPRLSVQRAPSRESSRSGCFDGVSICPESCTRVGRAAPEGSSGQPDRTAVRRQPLSGRVKQSGPCTDSESVPSGSKTSLFGPRTAGVSLTRAYYSSRAAATRLSVSAWPWGVCVVSVEAGDAWLFLRVPGLRDSYGAAASAQALLPISSRSITSVTRVRSSVSRSSESSADSPSA